MTRGKKVIALIFALMLAGAPAVLIAAGHDHHGHSNAPAAAGMAGDPLIEEMVRLDTVFRDVVSGVALGDGKRVHDALATMHGAMEMTHEGVHSGTVKLRKNADRLAEFVQLDKDFHGELEELAHAAHGNDQKKMLALTTKLLQGCVDCHQKFRP